MSDLRVRHAWLDVSRVSLSGMGLGPILLLAFTLRLIWALLVPVHPLSDAYMYHAFAQEIAAGRGYMFPNDAPTVYWPVGPAALYGGFYALLGVHYWVIVCINLVLGCGLVAGIYRLGARHFSPGVGAIASVMTALWPVWIQFTTVPNSELPFAALMVAAFLARGEQALPIWARTILSTALLVAAAFMRPTILPLIVILPLLDQPFRKPLRTALQLCIAIIVAAALLTPWAERNRALFGEPITISANFGANFWMGNNPASNGGYMPLPPIETKNEVTRDHYFKERAIAFIKENPADFALLCLKRVKMSFDRETIGIAWNEVGLPKVTQAPLKIVSSAYWLAALGLAFIGVALFLIEKPLRIFDPLIVAPAMFAAVAIIVVGGDRYHMPMMPFVALFAALAIERIIMWRYPASSKGDGIPLAA